METSSYGSSPQDRFLAATFINPRCTAPTLAVQHQLSSSPYNGHRITALFYHKLALLADNEGEVQGEGKGEGEVSIMN